MPSTPFPAVSLSFLTISGEFFYRLPRFKVDELTCCRLLDKIAKDIMVCEKKTVTRWGGSIGDYKKHLQKKMFASGSV